ncbi:4-(cytidine 5'-diphospho)-2-C-methyl-D-erythritol kinase [Marivirga sp. S37H4]|uniref:4-diphosphocytidyl-2-C-methyl-D-erythritol kinase n=1 Tax=Marivirga aurantiaca TaxID=2802615 RepID=A0A934WW51_9BACT|nr:4-(cytidine 5'-diphospho)-2-C-methyl-D-erythritol kinase [Marivirga aurantiaca]MBK6264037.1 4-(cytidine 5'-diphospho)-2-C-methyl-D-erythritol kinase [Marivirga aurantiaca]
MISFPNAKINLGLNILSKRADGYHNISSCFYPIPVKDALEIIPAQRTTFESTGLKIPGKPEENLVWKAYHLLNKEFNLPEVEIVLHKAIPMGAGIGGGSADGAFMLKLLNDYFKLNLSTEKLENYALKLGSDCPFFIQNKPKLVSGRGEIFEDIAVDLQGYFVGLVFPGIHIGTKEAYNGIHPKNPETPIKEIIENHPLKDWKNNLKNDFEESVFKQHPTLALIKNKLYDSGAIYASMTGSGSTMYGIFKEKPEGSIVDQLYNL